MHQNFLWVIIRPAILCLLVAGSLALTSRPAFAQQTAAPTSPALKAVMRDGQPAVECSEKGFTWTISKAEYNMNVAFRVPLERWKGIRPQPGNLFVTSDTVAFQAQDSQVLFDEKWALVKWELNGNWFRANTAHGNYIFYVHTFGHNPSADLPDCEALLKLILTDFKAAELRFSALTKRLPPARETAWRDFQPKAAAWRALPAKPSISDDVKQHRLVAEDAFQQKQFETAVAEYEAGLEIDPLWAQGHFNAALIYGELKDYDDAVWHMRCYLELMPDASDAQTARDQMLLWQGKAKQQAATQY